MSASLFYTYPQNVHSLIRPNTENGLLIADPGNNSFLRGTFLCDPGDHLIFVSEKPAPRGLFPTGNSSQRVITLLLDLVEYFW